MSYTDATVIAGIPVYDSNRPGQIIPNTIINPYSALTMPAFWRAVNFLADNLASFPRSVHLNQSPTEAANHPLNPILKRRPNEYQNPFQLWRTLFGHAANYGNGYMRVRRDPTTLAPVAFDNIMPHYVLPFRYGPPGAETQQWYLVRNTKEIVHFSDMIHLQALSYDGMMGYDVVWMHRESLQRGLTLDKFMTRFLTHGTVIRGVIQIPTGVTTEQIDEIEARLRNFFRGPQHSRDVLTLSDGATFSNETLTPEDSQLMQQGAYTTKQIAQVTGVPPQFLYEFGEQKYNPASIEQLGQDVVRYTFRPWIEQTEAELSCKLLSDAEQAQGYEVKLDPNALLRGDTSAETNVAVQRVNAGIETPNEARAGLNLPRSDSPEASTLKRSGDTTPTSPPTQGPALKE